MGFPIGGLMCGVCVSFIGKRYSGIFGLAGSFIIGMKKSANKLFHFIRYPRIILCYSEEYVCINFTEGQNSNRHKTKTKL